MSRAADDLDRWMRTSFVAMNTELEELYFAQADRANVEGVGDKIKKTLADDGRALIRPLAAEGNTNEGFDRAFDVLGNLGLFLGALRRHELTNPAREEQSPFAEASALGLHIGASLGVAPRFATAHLATHNRAVDGVQKSFTSLADEFVFIDYNTMGILSYKRAADALMRIPPLGISNRSALMLLENARDALHDVAKTNDVLFRKLDKDRFFYCVRPYYKPYRVGRQEYRGANAGDFSGINQIDLLLGLCRANDPSYSQLLIDKMLFMIPEDQKSLRACLIHVPLARPVPGSRLRVAGQGLVQGQRARVPGGLRGAWPRRDPASQPALRELHREDVGRAGPEASRPAHRQRPAASGAGQGARTPARPALRRQARRSGDGA